MQQKGSAASRGDDEKCLVCGEVNSQVLGIRGNHEYFGADLNVKPHLYTSIVQCSDCGFIYLSPRIPQTAILEKEHYSNPEYYEAVSGGNSFAMFGSRLSFIEKFKSPSSMLDIGAGKGEFLAEAKKKGWEIAGLEPSAEFCQYAKREYNVDLFNGELEDYQHASTKKFDVITLNHVLEHIAAPYPLIECINTLLTEKGILCIEVPNTSSNLLKLADLYFKMKGLNWSSRLSPLHPPFHEFGYSPKSLQFLLRKTGFNILDTHTFSGRDRGKTKVHNFTSAMRDVSARVLDMFGNRELLYMVAQRAA